MTANLTTRLGQLADVLTPDTTNIRIGIGMTPARTLDVTGTFGVTGASTLGGAQTNTVAGVPYQWTGNGATVYPANSNGGAVSYNFSNGGAEVSFWNTASAGPTNSFIWRQMTGASSNTALMTLTGAGLLSVGTGWNVSSVGLCAFSTGSTGNVTAYTFTNPNGIVGYIQTVGSSTTFSTSSDERKKDWAEVIQKDYRQSIQDLWVGDYTWKVDGTKGFGVRAQQAYSVLGGLGVVKQDDENVAWGVSSEPFAFLALWGVKDLYKIIDDLTTRLAALETK